MPVNPGTTGYAMYSRQAESQKTLFCQTVPIERCMANCTMLPPGMTANMEALLGPRDAELLHLPVQRGTLHPQADRGTFRAAQHPTCLAEDTENVLPLGVGQRECGGRRTEIRGQRPIFGRWYLTSDF